MRHRPTTHLHTTPTRALDEDTAQGVPMPAQIPGQPDTITALEHLMNTSNANLAVAAQLVDYLAGMTEPPEYRVIAFPIGEQIVHDNAGAVSPSVGYYNPDPVRSVWLDVTGAGVDQRSRAIELPPLSTGCFPVKVQRISYALEVAAVTELVLHTWRYRSLQPLS